MSSILQRVHMALKHRIAHNEPWALLHTCACEIEQRDILITELVGALDDALDDLNTDIRWADGSQLEGLIERRTKLEAVLAKAKGSEQ